MVAHEVDHRRPHLLDEQPPQIPPANGRPADHPLLARGRVQDRPRERRKAKTPAMATQEIGPMRAAIPEVEARATARDAHIANEATPEVLVGAAMRRAPRL